MDSEGGWIAPARWRATSVLITLVALASAQPVRAQNVLTERYDNARTGAYLSETQLTPSTVNTGNFGKVWSYVVNGSVFAQPLYVQNVSINGGIHNVVYIVTMNNGVYAYEADSSNLFWHIFISDPVGVPVPIADITGNSSQNITWNVGIESTPVIDPLTNTLYLVARTKESGSTCGPVNSHYCQRLHALDIGTGAEKFGGPVTINANVGGLIFDPLNENQRASLALANGQVYIAWASHEDQGVWYGWIMSYNASTLQQTGTYVPSQAGNGVWMSGRAPAVDASGNVYFMTGNGNWDGSRNFSESMLKFSSGSGLTLLEWFTPDNHPYLNTNDLDYGASGPLLVPGTSLVVGGGKYGVFYVMSTGSLGHVQSGNGQIVQSLNNNGGYIKSGPVYWNRSGGAGPWMYDWSDGSGGGDVLKAYHFNGSNFDPTPVSRSTISAPGGNSGGVLTLSANGGTPGTGIVWASMPANADGNDGVHAGILRAFNADDLTQEVWDSGHNSADNMGNWPKFSAPLIANGRVYVGSYSSDGLLASVSVYGVGPNPPQLHNDGLDCNGAYAVSWNSVPSATIYQLWVKYPGQGAYSTLMSTSGTFADVQTASQGGATLFEVQGCNGAVCGRLSNALALSYFKGCP